MISTSPQMDVPGSQPPPRKGHLRQCWYHALEAPASLEVFTIVSVSSSSERCRSCRIHILVHRRAYPLNDFKVNVNAQFHWILSSLLRMHSLSAISEALICFVSLTRDWNWRCKTYLRTLKMFFNGVRISLPSLLQHNLIIPSHGD